MAAAESSSAFNAENVAAGERSEPVDGWMDGWMNGQKCPQANGVSLSFVHFVHQCE